MRLVPTTSLAYPTQVSSSAQRGHFRCGIRIVALFAESLDSGLIYRRAGTADFNWGAKKTPGHVAGGVDRQSQLILEILEN
jgi:hypothetical protein